MAPLILVVQLDPTDPPARLGQWLRDAGADLDVRALDAGEQLPTDLSPYQGVIVLGGWMGALDDDVAPFLPGVRALLRETVAGELPTLGVCLGHQLLAVSHGGQVQVHPDGPEVGALLVAKRTAAARDPLFGALPITPDVIQWHSDEVSTLPSGAIQLYNSPHTEYQAFRLGRLAWGVQFHIENTAEMIREWAAQRDENLAHYDIDAIADRAIGLLDDIEEVWRPFAAAFVEIATNPDSVRPAVGVPTATAAPITDPAAIRAALAAELTSSRASLPMPGVRTPDES